MSIEDDKKSNFSTNLSSIVNDLKNLRNELSNDDDSNDTDKPSISDALQEDLQNLSNESLDNIDLQSLAMDINSDDITIEDTINTSLADIEDTTSEIKENIYLDVEKYAMDEIDNIDDFISDEEDSVSQMIDNINLPNETENIETLLTGDDDMVLEDNESYLVKEIELTDDDIFNLDVSIYGSFSSVALNDNM